MNEAIKRNNELLKEISERLNDGMEPLGHDFLVKHKLSPVDAVRLQGMMSDAIDNYIAMRSE